tara:strand:- start:318 stop:959 length:642 start_codon:yes stop_codon:yes gene_type:complete
MVIPFISKIARVRKQTEARLAEYKNKKVAFLFLIGVSSAIATLGLVLNNSSIVIGAMVVAPLITPVFGFSLGLIILRIHRIFESLFMLVLGTIVALCVSVLFSRLITLLDSHTLNITSEITARAEPSVLFFIVAILSGLAGAYAYAKPEILASIAGIAIAVAVIPPIAVSGIALVLNEWYLFQSSFLLYSINLLGICFGSLIMFLLLGFGKDV